MTAMGSSRPPILRLPLGVRVLCLREGECVILRPLRPGDAGALQAYVRGLSLHSRYSRFLVVLQELPSVELDHLLHLNRKYELALL